MGMSVQRKNKDALKITDEDFQQVVQSHPMVVVDCWAAWCGPCHIIAPVISQLAIEYSGKILFAKLNVDENQKISLQYGIMSIPTLLFFKKGELKDKLIGAVPKKYLVEKIEKLIKL